MAIIGTFNGFNVVAIPRWYSEGPSKASSGFTQVTLSMHTSVAMTESPYTKQQKKFDWPGGDWWEGQASLPPMHRAKAQEWIAFLAELRGPLNYFKIGDPLGRKPQGNPQGAPKYHATSAMAQTISTYGWKANASRLLLPGDYIQVGDNGASRLHIVLDLVQSDSLGNAVLSVWPSVRETLGEGGSIITKDCVGLFRLSENVQDISISNAQTYGLAFKFKEGR